MLRKTPTVTSILAGFNKQIEALRQIAVREQLNQEAAEQAVEAAMDRAAEASIEKTRANNVADKIAALIA